MSSTFDHLKTVSLELQKKGRLSYASWSDVWTAVMDYDDKAIYQVHENDKGFPMFYNKTGGMVKVSVTIKEVTRTMWLPILGYDNKSLTIDKITTFEINKTIQRCLVKCVALFGLGLYIYRGEDIPMTVEDSAE